MIKILDGTAYEEPEKCPYCGRGEFEKAEKHGPHISVRCKNCGGWTHAKQSNHKHWAEIVKRRANYRCERCGKPVQGRGAHAHHKLPRWFMPEREFDPDNGVCLCTECHKQIHGGCGTISNTPKETREEQIKQTEEFERELSERW